MKILAAIIILFSLTSCNKPSLEPAEQMSGLDCAHAVKIVEVSDEYAWLKKHYPGFRMRKQSLSNCNDVAVDILEVSLPDGSTQNFYFDISIEQKRLEESIAKSMAKHGA